MSFIVSILFLRTILDSSMVEHSAVNRRVAGSSPARGAITLGEVFHEPSVKPARPLSEVSHELSGAGGACDRMLRLRADARLR